MRAILQTAFTLLFLPVLFGFNTQLVAEEENQITVRVILPTGQVANVEELVEGEAVDIVGMTFPFQYLNGGKLLFPEGSINEHITLDIEIPDYVTLQENAVNFGENIASAIRLRVNNGDDYASPYYFEKPIELTLPIPENLPTSIGEQVSSFVLAYRDTEGNFDTTGIRTRVRDEVERILTAEVDHFSDIVMIPSSALNNDEDKDKHTITVEVQLPSGQVADLSELVEGTALNIVGLTFPFQYLNGGKLLFPEGSLNENITLTIKVPDFATLADNAVSFGDQIASAVRFIVSTDEGEISPYYFEKPIELTLPIPENLPTSIGEQVSSFVLAYRDTEGNFDTTGVRTRVRDEVERILMAEVDHFSDIVMVPSSYVGTPTTVDKDRQIPVEFALHQNYPNPFNPETIIQYDIPERVHVQINIYNVLGQKIATLVNEMKEPGQYSVPFHSGSLPSGIYIAAFESGEVQKMIRMMLLK